MAYYCNKCKKLHSNDEICPIYLEQIKRNPIILKQAVEFTSVAGQYALVSTQALDKVCTAVNKLYGANLSFEGSHQIARDIMVFKRLNTEAFCKIGVFSTPMKAQKYAAQSLSSSNTQTRNAFISKLTGAGQEVDYKLLKDGQLSSLWQKSELLTGNAKGVDAITINRFTGRAINQTTIKATANERSNYPIESIMNSIEKGNTSPEDIIFSTKGTKERAIKKGLSNPVIEHNTPEQVRESNERLCKKILDGQANCEITAGMVAEKALQGAVVGCAIGLTTSGIMNYMRYKNGEITVEEAFSEVGEDALKSSISGGALSAVTLFLPAGVIGLVGGMAIGVYVDAVTSNILDEVFGKGAYEAILTSSGCVMATCQNLLDAAAQIREITNDIKCNNEKVDEDIKKFDEVFSAIEDIMGELS